MNDLLKPRFKLIADYPYNINVVGTIFSIDTYQETFYGKYPAVFKKLEWWEDRKLEEMPQYLKIGDQNIICKVDEVVANVGFTYFENKNKKVFSTNILPATLEEYNEFLKK